jgi:hypothetical protein
VRVCECDKDLRRRAPRGEEVFSCSTLCERGRRARRHTVESAGIGSDALASLGLSERPRWVLSVLNAGLIWACSKSSSGEHSRRDAFAGPSGAYWTGYFLAFRDSICDCLVSALAAGSPDGTVGYKEEESLFEEKTSKWPSCPIILIKEWKELCSPIQRGEAQETLK